jgi:methionyl-tRNA formyltransferase
MKIIFFGSGKFAVKVLDALKKGGHDIPLVVTRPDRKKGRHLHLASTPVKDFALSKRLGLFQPEDINAKESVDRLQQERAELFLVVSYGRILSQKVLDIPSFGPVHIHASLLPKYRGAAPMNYALMHGDKKTGVTFMKMSAKMDTGDILFQKPVRIDRRDTLPSLEDRLARAAAHYINPVLRRIGQRRLRSKKQDDRRVTYAPLIKKADGLIDWHQGASRIWNRYRGCSGWPGSYTFWHGRLLKITEMTIGSVWGRRGQPGAIVRFDKKTLEVATGRGTIVILEVIPEAHKRMTIQSFLAGHPVKAGDVFKNS